MARLDRGIASPETRGGRLSLKTWRPRNCSELAGGERFQDNHEADDAQRLEAWLYAERNRWDIARRAKGLGERRLDKRDANRLWQAAFGIGSDV